MTVASENHAVLELFPNGSWDAHHHIFDPAQFAYAADRHLTPPPATIEQSIRLKKSLGIIKSVLTHGLSYGANVESLKSFVNVLGQSATKRIGVIDPDTVIQEELQEMHKAGIRSICMLPPECEGDGQLYVKLSAPYRVSIQAPSYDDLELLVRAYMYANPKQILWGSDW
ncbi:hypothetical protein BBP40_009151 [Aspergillus hancockii]|nr:hypothetical protein BBP40_009151 [Aspergillus hancockii]